MFLNISSFFFFYLIPIWLFFMIISMIHLIISLGILLVCENIEGTVLIFFFQIRYADVVRWSLE